MKHRTLDVPHLPSYGWDEQSPLWWGNLLLTLIETTTLLIMFAMYFYIRQNYQEWPPPKVDVIPPIHRPVPGLGASTADVVLMLFACIPMYWTDMAARRKDKPRVLIGLGVMFLVSLAALTLRAYEFPATRFWWNDNAYASVVWTTLGLAVTYQLAAAGEFFIMGLWILGHELDEKHALDVTLAGGFWYWVAGTGLILYVVIFWGARFL
jgi:heme/copper-type cytochrome/quinol oxidase subunit 3